MANIKHCKNLKINIVSIIKFLISIIFIFNQIGIYLPEMAFSNNNYMLAPPSSVFEVALNTIFPENLRQQLESFSRDYFDSDAFNNLDPGSDQKKAIKDQFEANNIVFSDKIELNYRNDMTLGLIAGIIEYKESEDDDSRPGGVLLLSDTPLLSKEDNAEYWYIWENSEEFREYEKNKIKNLLDILQIKYCTSSDGRLIYLSPEGLGVWNNYYDGLEGMYDSVMKKKDDFKDKVKNICPEYIQRTAEFNHITMSIFVDYFREKLFNLQEKRPLLELREEMFFSKRRVLVKYLHFERVFNSFLPVLDIDYRLSDAKYMNLPNAISLGFVSMLGDWRLSNYQNKIMDKKQFELLTRHVCFSEAYYLTQYGYYVRNEFDKNDINPFRDSLFNKDLLNLIMQILHGQLNDTEKRILEISVEDNGSLLVMTILENHICRLKAFASRTFYKINTRPLRQCQGYEELLGSEIEEVIKIVELVRDKIGYMAIGRSIENALKHCQMQIGNLEVAVKGAKRSVISRMEEWKVPNPQFLMYQVKCLVYNEKDSGILPDDVERKKRDILDVTEYILDAYSKNINNYPDTFEIIHEGNCEVFKGILLFAPFYPETEKKDLLDRLYGIYQESIEDRPGIALILTYYYLYQKEHNITHCTDLEDGFKKDCDIDSLILRWWRNVFESLSESMIERKRLDEAGLSEIPGYYPGIPEALQEINRLFHFWINCFMVKGENAVSMIFDFSYTDDSIFELESGYLNRVVDMVLDEDNPNWDIVVPIYMMKALFIESGIGDLKEYKQSIVKLIDNNISDNKLKELFEYNQIDKTFILSVWADIALTHIESNGLEEKYQKTKQKLEEILFCYENQTVFQLIYLVLWHFKNGNSAKAVRMLRESLQREDIEAAVNGRYLQPYVNNIDVATQSVCKYVEKQALAWRIASEEVFIERARNIRNDPFLNDIEWVCEDVKNAVLLHFEEEEMWKIWFLGYLLIIMNDLSEKVYEINRPMARISESEYYAEILQKREKEVRILGIKIKEAIEVLKYDIDYEVKEAKSMKDRLAIEYRKNTVISENLRILAEAVKNHDSKDYVAAKEYMDQFNGELDNASNNVVRYISDLKRSIEKKASQYIKHKERVGDLLIKIGAYGNGDMSSGFINVSEDIKYLGHLKHSMPNIVKEINPDWDYDKLIERLKAVEKEAQELFELLKLYFKEVLNDNAVNVNNWLDLKGLLERLRKLDRRKFTLSVEETVDLCMKSYRNIHPMIVSGLRQKKNRHSIIGEDTYIKLDQLAFISGELYGYLRNSDNFALKDKIKTLYMVKSASHSAVVMQKIKISRLMLTVLANAEKRKMEELRGMASKRFCSYSNRPVALNKSGKEMRAIMKIDDLKDFAHIYKKERKIEKARRLFHPGNRIVFANEEKMFDNPDKYDLPTFEVVEVAEEGVVMECINFSLFKKETLAQLINDRIANGGLFDLRYATDTTIRRDFLNDLWMDLEKQIDKLNIMHKSQESTESGSRKKKKGKGKKRSKKKRGKKKKLGSEFKEVQIFRRYNNNPNNLVNVLLGLSTDRGMNDSNTDDEYAGDIDNSLNLAQKDAVSFLCNSVDSQRAKVEQRVAFIQGPGGSGKTYTLVRLCKELLSKGKTICLTAPTHVATDNMVLGLMGELDDDIPKRIGRFGSEELKIDPRVREICYRNREEFISGIIEDSKRGGVGRGHVLAHTIAGRDGDPELRKARIENAGILDALNKALGSHLVIVDEGGMTGFDQILMLADRAVASGGTIAIFGDPEQLPYYGMGPSHIKLIKDQFHISRNAGDTATFEGIDIQKTVFAEWIKEIYSTSLLEDRYGRSGTNSFFFDENRRSTDLIVELLNRVTYREGGNEMVSKREPLEEEPTEQLKMFDVSNRQNDQILGGRKGQYINVSEIGCLLRQMGEDFEQIDDFKGKDVVFISPYKAQIKLFENMLVLYCLMNEIENATKSGGKLSSFFDAESDDDIVRVVDFIMGAVNVLLELSNCRGKSAEIRKHLDYIIKSKKMDKLHRLKQLLYGTFGSNCLNYWVYSPKMTLVQAKGMELQNIADGFSVDGSGNILSEKRDGIHSSTVHKMQGKEKRAVYISLVRNNSRGKLGFLGEKLGHHMITTAVGRAEDYLRIAFNRRTWEKFSKGIPDNRREYHRWKSSNMVIEADKFINKVLPELEREINTAKRLVSSSV